MATKKTEKEESTENEKEKKTEEEGYYCIYCGDYVEPGQLHHH